MDIKVVRGDSCTFDVYATRFNPTTGNDEPISLAGAKMWFTCKLETRDTDTSALIRLNSADHPAQVRSISDPAGQIRVSLLPADTDGLPVSYLPYDVQLRESDGTVTTIVKGSIEVDRDRTISVA